MSQRIDQFCEDLRLKLTNIESGLKSIKGKVDEKAQHVEKDVRNHLERVEKRIDQGHAKALAAQAEVKHWVEDKKDATSEKIAEWKAKRETSKLQNRADKAERYAAATIDVALMALDEAEQASLEAWLARYDANAALSK